MRNTWTLVGWILTLAMACLAGAAEARVKLVEPGKVPKLDADEGLVAIVIDTTSSLADVRFRKDGAAFGAATIEGLNAGANPRLFVMPAGEYTFSRVTTFFNRYYRFNEDTELRFTVKPGVINYPGDLIARDTYTQWASFMLFNRGVQVMDWLETTHPALYAKYAFQYSGRYRDPFPALYAERRRASTLTLDQLGRGRKAPPPGELPIEITELWRASAIENADLNGRGDLMVQVDNVGRRTVLKVVEYPSGKSTELFSMQREVESMMWAGDDVFVTVSRTEAGQASYLDAFRFSRSADGVLSFERVSRDFLANWVQILPGNPDQVLVATRGDGGRLLVHRVGIRTQAALDRFTFVEGTRINRGVKDDFYWLSDRVGNLRLAMASVEGAAGDADDDAPGRQTVLLHGMGNQFREVMRFGLEQPFEPVALSPDGSLIYGLSDVGRAQRDLVQFDPAQGKITQTLFTRPGVDVVLPVLDDVDGRLIGAAYYDLGHLVTHYFDASASRAAAAMTAKFPAASVGGLDRARNGDMLFWVESSDDPGGLYRYEAATGAITLVAASHPWFKDVTFRTTEVLNVPAPDGATIEAYLTRPAQPGKRPLVVLAHGGPVGVRDARGFNPEVQLLASMGYAVLQVNFRGSDGFGTAFREQGKRGYGTRIEDDIDTVLQQVLRDPTIDGSRMCAVGSSYGGYSALVSAIRWPDRYKCVVSLSGVTDWMLFFTASDGGSSARGREALEHYIGDPSTDADALLDISPLYRAGELKTPIMLVHGSEDMRVDYEHTRRLVRMLNLAGVIPTVVPMEGVGHGFETVGQVETAWGGIAGFLRKHLDGVTTAPARAPAPAPEKAAAPAKAGEGASAGP